MTDQEVIQYALLKLHNKLNSIPYTQRKLENPGIGNILELQKKVRKLLNNEQTPIT